MDEAFRPELGYACINNELAAQGTKVNRTQQLKTISAEGLEGLRALIEKNIADCLEILKWNHSRNIKFYRMSSGMLPHIYNDRMESPEKHTPEYFRKGLEKLGEFAAANGHRLSFHVGQYTLLSNTSETILQRSITDLKTHTEILQIIESKYDPGHLRGVIILHGGGVYEDKENSLRVIRENVRNLSAEIRSRIVFENDERSYCPEDLLPICEEFSLPFCLDVFHYKCYVKDMEKYKEMLADNKLWDRVRATWVIRGLKMKIHVSSQKKDGPLGAHADFIDEDEILYPQVYAQASRCGSDIMVEAKAKEAALLRLRDKK